MKKIIIVMLLILFLTGCEEKKEKPQEKPKEKDYSEYLFTNVSWTRDAENDIETIRFTKEGDFTYYCACGTPVNDSDLCEGYTYDEKTQTITLDCIEITDEMVTTIKVVKCTDSILELDFNGEIRKFEKE